MRTSLLLATFFFLALSAPMERGIDIHAAIFQSEDKVSSGGYLTNKFTSLLFTPTIHQINMKLEALANSIQQNSSQDMYQNIGLSVAGVIVSVTIVFLIKKIRHFRKKIQIKS